jgi:hypothetical protein
MNLMMARCLFGRALAIRTNSSELHFASILSVKIAFFLP